MRFGSIVLVCVVLAVVYGVVHDQITARVCVEYFTVGHPKIVESDDPTLLGLVWGVVATWWVGLLLGIPLGWAALAGDAPQRSLRSLFRPLGVLLAVMGASAAVAGVVGLQLARHRVVALSESFASLLPPGRHDAFVADAFAHVASYAVGIVGGVLLVASVWNSRRLERLRASRAARLHPPRA